jgi:hypothetical protein
MKSAIDMEHLTGAVIELAVGNGPDSASYVTWFSHTALRQETRSNALIIFGSYGSDHVGSNDAGLNFNHLNIVGRQARSE